jgi:hypothetical protein
MQTMPPLNASWNQEPGANWPRMGPKTGREFSLSPRERAGVRGNSAPQTRSHFESKSLFMDLFRYRQKRRERPGTLANGQSDSISLYPTYAHQIFLRIYVRLLQSVACLRKDHGNQWKPTVTKRNQTYVNVTYGRRENPNKPSERVSPDPKIPCVLASLRWILHCLQPLNMAYPPR